MDYESAICGGIVMAVGRSINVFYADGGLIGLRYLELLQGAINVLIVVFRRVCLLANIKKSKTMTCQPEAIFTGMSEEDFSWMGIGERSTYRERLKWCIPCPYFEMELTAGSMMAHCR